MARFKALERPGGPQRFVKRLAEEDDKGLEDAQMYLVAYGDRMRAVAVCLLARDALNDRVTKAIVVERDQWWSDQDSPNVSGVPVHLADQDVATSVAAPEGEHEQRMVAVFAAVIEAVPSDHAEAGELVLEMMNAWLRGDDLTDAQYLAAGIAMANSEARDVVWRWLDRDKAIEFLPFWKQVLIRTPQGARPVVLAFTGFLAWVGGDEALLHVCNGEAENTGSTNSLVRMVAQIVESRLPSTVWDLVLGHLKLHR